MQGPADAEKISNCHPHGANNGQPTSPAQGSLLTQYWRDIVFKNLVLRISQYCYSIHTQLFTGIYLPVWKRRPRGAHQSINSIIPRAYIYRYMYSVLEYHTRVP